MQQHQTDLSLNDRRSDQQQQIMPSNPEDSFLKQNHQKFQQPIKVKKTISAKRAKKSLQEIFCFYSKSYVLARQKFVIFEGMQEQKLDFQPYILFMKNFNISKTIFTIDKLKLIFNKYSSSGMCLVLDKFIQMINEISQEPEAKLFFATNQNEFQKGFDSDEYFKQSMYQYLHLDDPKKFRLLFQNVFQPFLCKNKSDFEPSSYEFKGPTKPHAPIFRTLSVRKIKEDDGPKAKLSLRKASVNSIENNKQVFVSWESLKSKSLAFLHKQIDSLKRKYVRQEPQDQFFLREYDTKKKSQEKRVSKKVQEMKKQRESKNKAVIAMIELKTNKNRLLVKKEKNK